MVTQQKAQSANFEPMWPEVTGFGAGPNKQIFCVLPQGKMQKIRNNGHCCIACRLPFSGEQLKSRK